MNKAQLKCLAVFSIFAIIGFGPVSLGCLIGMYITVKRPQWFSELMDEMYQHRVMDNSKPKGLASYRLKVFLSILTLFIIDIAPVPVTPVIAFIIILSRPNWFYRVVLNVYNNEK
jgi:hypothetical protein